MAEVTELPVGQYDPVRTLRHLLAQAEAGKFTHVVVICNRRTPDPEMTDEIWASWSDSDSQHVWWMASWFVSFLRRRYFSGRGIVEE